MGKVCRHCGAVIGDNDRYCENCGAKYENVNEGFVNNPVNESAKYASYVLQSSPVSSDYKINKYSYGKWFWLSFVTLDIYAIYWGYKLTKDINKLCKDKMKPLPNYFLVIFLSVITLGIYGAYWSYQVAKRLYEISPVYGVEVKEKPHFMLLMNELGMSIVGGISVLWVSYICKNMNILRMPYNDGFRNPDAEIKRNYSSTGNKVQLVISIILAIALMIMSVFNFINIFVGSKEATTDSGKYLLNSQMLIDNDGLQGYIDEEMDRIDSDFQKSECGKENPGYNLRYENVTSSDSLDFSRDFDVYISNRANDNIDASDSPQFQYSFGDTDRDGRIDMVVIQFYSYGTIENGWGDFLWDEISETVKRNLTVLTDLSTEKREEVYETLWGETKEGGTVGWYNTNEPIACKTDNFYIYAQYVSSGESNFIFTSIQAGESINNAVDYVNIIDLSSNGAI